MTEAIIPLGITSDTQVPLKRKRGRPRKHPIPLSRNLPPPPPRPQMGQELPSIPSGALTGDVPMKRKRGRSRKIPLPPSNAEVIYVEAEVKREGEEPEPSTWIYSGLFRDKYMRFGNHGQQNYPNALAKRLRNDPEENLNFQNEENISRTGNIQNQHSEERPSTSENIDVQSLRAEERSRMVLVCEDSVIGTWNSYSITEPIDMMNDCNDGLEDIDERFNDSSFDALYDDLMLERHRES